MEFEWILVRCSLTLLCMTSCFSLTLRNFHLNLIDPLIPNKPKTYMKHKPHNNFQKWINQVTHHFSKAFHHGCVDGHTWRAWDVAMCSLCLAVQASVHVSDFRGLRLKLRFFLADFDRQTGKSRIGYTSLFALFSLMVKRSILIYISKQQTSQVCRSKAIKQKCQLVQCTPHASMSVSLEISILYSIVLIFLHFWSISIHSLMTYIRMFHDVPLLSFLESIQVSSKSIY